MKIIVLFAACMAMINCIEAWRFDKYRNMSPRERDIVIQIAIHSNSKTEKANYMVDQLDSKLGESGHLWTCLYVADPALLQSSRLLWLTKSFSLKQNGHASYASEIISSGATRMRAKRASE